MQAFLSVCQSEELLFQAKMLFAGFRGPAHSGKAMVFRSHRPIFGRIDHGTLSRIHSPDLSRSEEWDAQKGPNQREISMKPNALRWHFDQPSLHLRPHGVQRFRATLAVLSKEATFATAASSRSGLVMLPHVLEVGLFLVISAEL